MASNPKLNPHISPQTLGNAENWGHAKAHVRAKLLVPQQDQPRDYVIATGESHTIRDLLNVAFTHVGLDWQDQVQIDERFKRPTNACELLANPRKAGSLLDKNSCIRFCGMVILMVDCDNRRLS